jgi:hypothetical protein
VGIKNHFGGIARASTVVLIEVNTIRIKGISPIKATTAKKRYFRKRRRLFA